MSPDVQTILKALKMRKIRKVIKNHIYTEETTVFFIIIFLFFMNNNLLKGKKPHLHTKKKKKKKTYTREATTHLGFFHLS
jgi:hypothetical protein